jgi:adenylate cyclase
MVALSAFRLVTDGLISRHEGRICGTAGDSILAAFGSALAAVRCAVDIQNELAHSNNNLKKNRRMQFRIGINVGDVMLKDGDIFGDGVNIAARLEGLADPGGICISRVALARVRLEAIREDAVSMRDPHDREIELSFWESVRESGNAALVQAYRQKYPNGEFRTLAQIRIDELTPDGHHVVERR